MAVQDNQIKAAINEYFFKNRADFEAHKDEILNNSKFYIEDDGLGVVTMQTKVLWENSSPTSSFAAQTITVEDMSEYDYLMFNFLGANNVDWGFSQLIKKDIAHRLFYADGAGQRVCIRNFTINSSTSITFEAAIYNGASSTTELVPIQIIGIKLIESPTQITNKYSTEETVVGEWIDGKKIYRKTMQFTITSTSMTTTYDFSDVDTIVNPNSVSVGGEFVPITYVSQVSYQVTWYIGTDKKLHINASQPWLNGIASITLEYTKTTD